MGQNSQGMVIAGVAYAWTGCHDWSLPFDVELWHVAIAVALLICWKPANIFIKLMLKHYSVNMPAEKESGFNAGALIKWLTNGSQLHHLRFEIQGLVVKD